MIQETITHICRVCKSTNIVKNGSNRCGNLQYHCKDCGTYRVLQPKILYSEAEKRTVLQASQERSSLRGMQRVFGVARQTVAEWIKTSAQKLPEIEDILLAATPNDVLELDEVWSFVVKKGQKRWLWTAMCRRTCQIVAFVIGDRSKATCLRLWTAIPDAYKHCHTFSDFWIAYRQVFPAETHRCVGKETGETAHMERWNNTLRQRVGRYVRQILSFSKSDLHHYLFTKSFIIQYNLEISLTT
jgi:IS1 family transposase/transposase-like protein